MADTFVERSLRHVEWYVSFRSPRDTWNSHPSYLVAEVLFYFGAILTLNHARRFGGRYKTLWLTIVLHGLVVESISYLLPEIDNFWHAQSCVMLLGHRLPLHIICFYPTFLYTASVAVSRLKLSWRSEPLAVGLAVVLLDIPFDILGVKLLWWSWHDTDPNIGERSFSVPWTSYYFHASFATAITFLIHGSRKLLTGNEKFESRSSLKEAACVFITGFMSMPLGCLLFVLFYHSLHDIYKVNSEVIVLGYLALYALVFWIADRKPADTARLGRKAAFDEIILLVITYFTTLLVIFLTSKPEQIVSEGLHQQIGSCHVKDIVHSPVGVKLQKGRYLCLSDYDEPYFDFSCLEEKHLPSDGSYWYKICGTPYQCYTEYVILISGATIGGLAFFYQLLMRSGLDVVTEISKIKRL